MTEPVTVFQQLPVAASGQQPATQVDSDSSQSTRVTARGATVYYHTTPNVSSVTNAGSIANGVSINVPGTYWFATAAGVRASIDVVKTPFVSATASSSVLGGRPIVVTRCADNYALDAGYMTDANPGVMTKQKHTFVSACADIRLFFAEPVISTNIDINGSVGLHVGFEVADGSVFPVTFNGNPYGRVDPGSGGVLSDPVPYEFAVGDIAYSRVYQFAPGGNQTTLAALSTAGDQTLTLTAPLYPGGGYCIVDSGANLELVEILDYTGTGPYVARLRRKTTISHANGVSIGQHKITNVLLQGAYGDLAGNGGTDQSQSGTVAALAGTATTLSADTSISDTSLTMAGTPYGTTLTVDTAGNAETVTVRAITGTGAPYKVWLTAPLTKAHTSGVAISSTYTFASGFGPTAVVADRIAPGSVRKKTVYTAGDSIVAGTGDLVLPSGSGAGYAARALLGTVPLVNTSRAGESVQQFVTVAIGRRRKLFLSMADWMLYQYGVNDIYGSRTLAQFEADCKTVWNWAKTRGLKVAACTLTPRTTSSDEWLTVGNQTVTLPSGANLVRQAYNANLRSGVYSPLVDVVFDPAALVEANSTGVVTAGGDYWKADASGPYTVDGVHPSYPGHVLMATAIDPAIFV